MEFEAAKIMTIRPVLVDELVFNSLLNANDIGIIRTDSNFVIKSANSAFFKKFESILGQKILPGLDLKAALHHANQPDPFTLIQVNNAPDKKKWELHDLLGNEFYFEISIFPADSIFSENTDFIVSFKDITNETLLHRKLEISTNLKSSLFNQSNDGILIYNVAQGKIIDCNKKASSLFQTEAKNLIGKNIFDLVEGDGAQEEIHFRSQVFENTSYSRDYLFKTVSNNLFWGNLGFAPVLAKHTIGLIRITDISNLYESKLALIKSQSYLKSILNVVPCGYILLGSDKIAIDFNQEFQAFHKSLTGKELDCGIDFTREMKEEDKSEFLQMYEKALRGETISYERNFNNKWFIIRHLPVNNFSGNIESVLIGLVDITERKQLEQNVEKKEYICRTLLQNIPDTDVFLYNRDNEIVVGAGKVLNRINIFAEKLAGKTLEEIVHLMPEQKRERVIKNWKKALAGETVNYVVDRNNEFLRIKFTPVNDDQGNTIFGLCMINDITKEKNKEIALTQSGQFNRSIIDSIPDNLCVLNETGEILAVNKAWKDFSRMNCGEAAYTCEGVNYLDICNATDNCEDALVFQNAIKDVLSGSIPDFTWEYPCHSPYTQRWYSGKITRFHSDGGAKALVVHQNITERKRIEDVLNKQAHFIHKITDLVPVMIFIYDIEENEVCYYNTYSSNLLGYDQDWVKAQGKNLMSIVVHPDDMNAAKRAIEKYNGMKGTESGSLEYRLRKKDGEYIWVRSSGVVFQRNDQGEPKQVIISAKNITESKLAEEKLRHSYKALDEFKKALDISSIVSITNNKGDITYVNDHFCDISGYTRNELIGNTHNLINSGHHEPGFFKDMWKTISDGNVWHGIIRNKNKSGGHFWVNTHIVPFLDDEGKPTQYIVICTDITNLQKTKNQLQKSIEEKEGILTEVHHRVKNNMNIVISLLEMQSRRIDDQSTRVAIQESKNRMIAMALVHEKLYNTKEFYDIDFKSYTHKLLYKIISACNSNDQKRIGFNINSEEVTFPLDISMPIGLITNELISNSLKYSFDNISEGYINLELKKENDWWVFTFEDNGPGFSKELKISELKSMGMKLIVSLSRQIGGKITLPGIGSSKFTIEFKLKNDE